MPRRATSSADLVTLKTSQFSASWPIAKPAVDAAPAQ